MAVASVTADNTRIEDAESLTGWTGIGGGQGASAEGSFPYQGSLLVNRKVTSSSGAGFQYVPTTDGGSTHDMTSTAKKVMMAKVIVTDYGGLQSTNGQRVRIGSGSGAYYDYILAGSNAKIPSLDAYPPKGGLIIVPIDPNVAGYRDSTTGSPALGSVDYFGDVAAFSASTAKSENVGMDAIDVGTGLTLIGGDGADPDATFTDFLDFDEGTVNNRFGYVTSLNGVQLNCFGTLTIGTLAAATVFNDDSSEVVFLDGLFDAGWSGVSVSIENASSNVLLDRPMQSLGTDTVVNTRADLTVVGTAGVCTITAPVTNFRNVSLTSATTINGGANVKCQDLTQSSATITDCIIGTNAAANVAVINDPNFTNLSNMEFEQIGLGHAIELLTGAQTLTGIKFSGYGGTAGSNLVANSGASDAAIFNDTGTAITLTISGGDVPSVRNGVGSTTTVVAALDYEMTGLDAGADVTITDITIPASPVELFNEIAGVDGIVTYSFDGALSGTAIGVYIRNTIIENNEFDDVLPSASISFKPSQDNDDVYI